MASSELPPPERLQIPVPCDWCEAGAPGKHYCTVCRKTLCINCRSHHARLFKDHRVVPRAEMAICKDLECVDHADQNVTLYCEKCLCPICVDCVTGKHKLHPVTKLSEVVEEEKVKLQKQISDMEENDMSSISKALSDLQRAEDTYKDDVKNTNKEIEDDANNVKEELEKIKVEIDNVKTDLDKNLSDRKKNLSQVECRDLAKFDDLRKQLKKREDELKSKIAERKDKINGRDDNPVEFLQFMKSDKKEMEFPASSLEPPPIFQRPSYPKQDMPEILIEINLEHFTAKGSRSLKLIAPKILSSFKAKVQGSPRICMTHNGNAWVGGYNCDELILVNNSGRILNRRKIKHYPYDMAMMASGDIIMTPHTGDSKTVIRVRADGREEVIYNVEPFWARGVSVTSDQKILICAGNGKLVKCCGNGTDVQEIYNKGRPDSALFAIELSNNAICISDWSIKGLVIIDKNDQPIITITQPRGKKEYDPQGLACDRLGNILSCDCNNDCVYIINQKKQLKDLVGSSHKLKKPSRLAIDPDNNLWIAQEDGTIIVVKYLA